MDILLPIILLFIFLIIIFLLWNTKKLVVYEFERGLLFVQGKYVRELGPGQHWYFRFIHSVTKVDIRTRFVSLQGQEILSSDNIGIKVSLVCKYKVKDPYRSVVEVENYQQAVYLELQTNLRDILGEISIDDFLAKRKELGEELLKRTSDKVSEYGVLLEAVSLKDIMFPGDLKNIFAQVVNARKEGLAALERARGESAVLRNLANTASLLEKNPALLQLRILQTLEKNPGNTIILGDISEGELQKKIGFSKKDKE